MFNINRQSMDSAANQPYSKSRNANADNVVYDHFKLSIANVIDTLKDLSIYDMAQWINNIDRWIKNKTFKNTKTYGRGCIVFLDLGAQNFLYEPSYTHPGIIIAENKNMVLIVPCSSKKFSKKIPGIINATPADGFISNTGVQVDSLRWVSKNRIISTVGQISNNILNQIDRYILDITPTHTKEIMELKSENARLQRELDRLHESL
ncbi:MAG: type II toxin-antitoxin system PemK/MazF family toxin [Prevotella sp.]|nr:type II toxin-antitoxin system PemK/MazF family toxin [Prevotella sp.]MCM1473387.1 type II toxin-antitoxin system PemK/MazF family toxin [Muribaculaceae bacterium]